MSACAGWSVDARRPLRVSYFTFSVSAVFSAVRGATHLPYDEEDESGAQHQGEHVAEGRKGECHG